MKTLILCSSVHGHTRLICERIQSQLVAMGEEVTLAGLTEAPELSEFDKVLIGASIRHGKHQANVVSFMIQHRELLQQKICGFFSVSLVARKPGKNTPETNAYMQTFLTQINWQPPILEVFGGRLNYPGYGVVDRNIIRFIMWVTKGPTAADTDITFTDWDKVSALAVRFLQA
ncbi:menaquinone-dependent protoporphyrinogen IX dehydrogenase [Shewanella sp. NIFS-20-20]|uniref:menaquinone-dependent protoporphyrinogen IX dehydrogenase n=1 Tax=Shewanella sp. NIFS-20-20 TaxID=2853806 RepID=UPI003527646F